MPEVQEVFRDATREVRPEAGFADRQFDRQRRRTRNRRAGAYVGAAVMALVAAVLIARVLPGGDAQPANPSETDTSTIQPPQPGDLTPDVALKAFTSSLYGYSIAYPRPWYAHAATQPLTALGLPIEDPTLDYFSIEGPEVWIGGPDVQSYPALIIAAQPVDPGTTRQTWTSDVETFVDQCGPPMTKETVSVGGEKATLAYFTGCYYPGSNGIYKYWITFVHRGMGYHAIWMGHEGNETLDRAVLDRILEGFRFKD